MRAVLQRVRRASVEVVGTQPAGTMRRSIEHGFVVLLGVARGDTAAEAARLVEKMATLRVFQDAAGKMNLDIRQVAGAFLVVSQFTLLANVRKGRRPSFERAAAPAQGRALYVAVVAHLRALGFVVETGEFGAHMLVEIDNDGPVTIVLDTEEL